MESWKGFRELIVVDKIEECQDIISFYFKSKDGKSILPHIPGQFLPFKIQTEDAKYKDVLRTYSLSNHPSDELYRISVKKIEGGLISTYLHNHLNIGDVIEAMIPAGLFTISEKVINEKKTIVLLSGGIGITPVLSMLYKQVHNDSELYIVQAVQNSSMHPFKHDIETLAETNIVHSTVFYSHPLPSDELDKHYQQQGFVTKEWIKESLPLNADFYFCGPPPFMKALEQSLLDLGVPTSCIHYEFFSV